MKTLVKYLLGFFKCKIYKIEHKGKCYITSGKVRNRGSIIFGNDVIIRPSTDIYTHVTTSKIVVGDKVEIGNHSTISAYNKIVIGDNVLTGPHVFISDHNHKYTDPNIPIRNQGVMIKNNACLQIDDGTWIGTNVAIVGSVHIGKNCVIGANSVVTKDIPDYSVAVGMPCRVIKHYDFDRKEWVKI